MVGHLILLAALGAASDAAPRLLVDHAGFARG